MNLPRILPRKKLIQKSNKTTIIAMIFLDSERIEEFICLMVLFLVSVHDFR